MTSPTQLAPFPPSCDPDIPIAPYLQSCDPPHVCPPLPSCGLYPPSWDPNIQTCDHLTSLAQEDLEDSLGESCPVGGCVGGMGSEVAQGPEVCTIRKSTQGWTMKQDQPVNSIRSSFGEESVLYSQALDWPEIVIRCVAHSGHWEVWSHQQSG